MGEAVKAAIKAHETKKENQVLQVQKGNSYQPVSSPVEQILFLQRTLGNQAVQRLMKSGALQAKLMIGAPGDIYEQEADRVAEQVMRMPEPEVSKNKMISGQAHGTSIKRSCPKCTASRLREEEVLQPKEIPGLTPEVAPELKTDINAIRGGGQPLPESVRAFFEPRFGQDFSGVRVHTDAKVAETARAVNARAYTVGRDVVFGPRQYAPTTHEGRKLMAHELTHTIQQGIGVRSLSDVPQITPPYDLTEPQTVQEVDMAMMERTFLPSHCSYPVIARQTAAPAGGASSSSPSLTAGPDIFVNNTELDGLSVGNFDFHFRNCSILVWVWVKFQFTKDINPTEQIAFKQRFINAVHNVWAHTGYSLSGSNGCPCGTIPIEIQVEENTESFYHKLVDVERRTDEDRRPNVISDININFDSSDNTIAHEFGHVLGLYDEYNGGFFENIMFWHKNQNDPNALMSEGTELWPRYFEHYRKQVQAAAPEGCQYTISSPNPPVP